MIPLFFILLLLAALCAFGLYRVRREREQEKADRRRLQTSDMYAALLAGLQPDPRRAVASLSVSGEEVILRYLEPELSPRRFRLESAGYPPLDQRFVLPLAHALAFDIPALQDENAYHLVEKTMRSANGRTRITYVYELKMQVTADMRRTRRRRRE